jgi:capsular exopolysaccharide synthesis family protein
MGLEQPVELRRHLAAIKRSRIPIALFTLAVTAAALAASLALPKTYRAKATIAREEVAALLNPKDVESVERELETIQQLITTPAILEKAGQRIGRDPDEIRDRVEAADSPDANLIAVTARARDPETAALFANAVANAFLAAERDAEARRLSLARAKLLEELERLRRRGGSELEIEAIRSRLSELSVQEAAIGAELQLAQPAEPPEEAAAPRPVRNALLAFFASLVIGVLAALARDQLVPRVGGPRDLSRILDVPVIGGIPFVRQRWRRQLTTAAEFEAYQTLQAALRFQLPPEGQHVVLVTSARAGEGKTTVTAKLGRALARAGMRTLLISGDLRRPRLHELMNVRPSPGLTELLAQIERSTGKDGEPNLPEKLSRALRTNADLKLAVLPTGASTAESPRALLGAGLGTLLELVKDADYQYVLIDSPPLLGIADSQVLARHADAVVLVARPDRVTMDDVIDMRELLDRLGVDPVGLVVVGAKKEASYYYSRSPAAVET